MSFFKNSPPGFFFWHEGMLGQAGQCRDYKSERQWLRVTQVIGDFSLGIRPSHDREPPCLPTHSQDCHHVQHWWSPQQGEECQRVSHELQPTVTPVRGPQPVVGATHMTTLISRERGNATLLRTRWAAREGRCQQVHKDRQGRWRSLESFSSILKWQLHPRPALE